MSSLCPVNSGHEAYPSYLAGNSLPSYAARMLSTRTGAWDVIAAAVFELGIEEASPREKMLANLVDCVVALLTATHPASSAVRPRYNSASQYSQTE